MGVFDISFPPEGGSSSYTYSFNGECQGSIDDIRFIVSEGWLTATTATTSESVKKLTISAKVRPEQETEPREGYVYTYLNRENDSKCTDKTFTVSQSGHETKCGCEELATYPSFITITTVPSEGLTNRGWYNIGELHLERLGGVCQDLEKNDFEFYVAYDSNPNPISKYKITVVEQDNVEHIRLSMTNGGRLDIDANSMYQQNYLFSLKFKVGNNDCQNIRNYPVLQDGQIPCDCTSIDYFVTMWRSSYSTDGNTVRDFKVGDEYYTLIGSGNTLSCGYLEAESESIIFENQKIYTKIDEEDDSKFYFYGIITEKEDPEAGGDSTDVAVRFRKKTEAEFDPNCKMTFPVIRTVNSCSCNVFNRNLIDHYGRENSINYPEKVRCDGDLQFTEDSIARFPWIENCAYILAKVDENNWVHNVRSEKRNNYIYIKADIDSTTVQRSVNVTIDKYINLMAHVDDGRGNLVWKPIEELMGYGYVMRIIDNELVVGDSIESPVYKGAYIGYPCGTYNFTLTQGACEGCTCEELDLRIYDIEGGRYIDNVYNFPENSSTDYKIKLIWNASCGEIDGENIRISEGKLYDEDGVTEASWGHIDLRPNNEHAKNAFLILNQNDENDKNGYIDLTIISNGNECKPDRERMRQYGTFDCNECSHLLRDVQSRYYASITFNEYGDDSYSFIWLTSSHHECVDVSGITCNENGEYQQYNWLTLSHTASGEYINVNELPSGVNERTGYVKGILLSNGNQVNNCGEFPFITKIIQKRGQETCNCGDKPNSYDYEITIHSANNGSGQQQIGTFRPSEPLKDCLRINIVSTQKAPNDEYYAEPSLSVGADNQTYTIKVNVNNEVKPLSPSGTPLDELPIGFTINILYEDETCDQININEQFSVIWP